MTSKSSSLITAGSFGFKWLLFYLSDSVSFLITRNTVPPYGGPPEVSPAISNHISCKNIFTIFLSFLCDHMWGRAIKNPEIREVTFSLLPQSQNHWYTERRGQEKHMNNQRCLEMFHLADWAGHRSTEKWFADCLGGWKNETDTVKGVS